MHKLPLSDHFLSADASFLEDTNSVIKTFDEQIHELATTESNTARSALHNVASLANRTNRYKMLGTPTDIRPVSNAKVTLQEFNERPKPAELFTTNSRVDEPIYYRPRLAQTALLLEDWTRFEKPKPQNPILIRDPPLEAADDTTRSGPTGDWMSPVVKEALRRQVSKEKYFMSLWSGILRLGIFHLVLNLAEYLLRLYVVGQQKSIYGLPGKVEMAATFLLDHSAHIFHVQWLFVLQICVSTVFLVWPQNQCWDLPLTRKQRELIGLKTDGHEDFDSDIALKQRLFESRYLEPIEVPKYAAMGDLTSIVRVPVAPPQKDMAELSDALPPKRTLRTSHVVPVRGFSESEREDFYRTFGVDLRE